MKSRQQSAKWQVRNGSASPRSRRPGGNASKAAADMSHRQHFVSAFDDRDIDAVLAHYHPDYTFVRHQTKTTLTLPEWKPMMEGMMKSDKLELLESRCLYENDDVLVMHNFMAFPDGTKEAVLAFHTLKDGKILSTETGATPLKA